MGAKLYLYVYNKLDSQFYINFSRYRYMNSTRYGEIYEKV